MAPPRSAVLLSARAVLFTCWWEDLSTPCGSCRDLIGVDAGGIRSGDTAPADVRPGFKRDARAPGVASVRSDSQSVESARHADTDARVNRCRCGCRCWPRADATDGGVSGQSLGPGSHCAHADSPRCWCRRPLESTRWTTRCRQSFGVAQIDHRDSRRFDDRLGASNLRATHRHSSWQLHGTLAVLRTGATVASWPATLGGGIRMGRHVRRRAAPGFLRGAWLAVRREPCEMGRVALAGRTGGSRRNCGRCSPSSRHIYRVSWRVVAACLRCIALVSDTRRWANVRPRCVLAGRTRCPLAGDVARRSPGLCDTRSRPAAVARVDCIRPAPWHRIGCGCAPAQ